MQSLFRNCIPLLTLLILGTLLTGCLEDRTKIIIRPDGSALIESQITISDRLMLAMEEQATAEGEDGAMSMSMSPEMPFTEEQLREQFGEEVELKSVTVEDKDDGSRVLSFTAEVPNIVDYIEGMDEGSTLNLRLVKLDDETGAVIWEGLKQEGNMDMSLEQFYAIAKGLYLQHSVTLPVELDAEAGELSEDAKTVTWTYDLRDQQGFRQTKTLMEAVGDDGVAQATFPLSALQIELPAYSGGASIQPQGVTATETGAEEEGLGAQVATLTLTRSKQIAPDDLMEQTRFFGSGDDSLNVEVLLTWSDGNAPSSYKSPVIEEIRTNTGESLLDEDATSFDHESDVGDDPQFVLDGVAVKAPSQEATELAIVRGYFPVVAGVETATVTVENPADKVGEGAIADEVLQKVGVYLDSVDGAEVSIGASGNVVEDVVLVKAGGERLGEAGTGWSAFNDNYTFTYSFDKPVEAGDKLEIVVRQAENRVKVPFQAENVPLP